MPVDRSAIDGQLREIGEGERWWEQREFRDLPYILNSDESIHGIVNGKLLGPRRPRLLPSARWLIVATSQRLICLRKERFGRQQVDVPLSQVTGLRQVSRVRGVQLTLDTPQGRYRLRISREDAFRFLGALAPLVSKSAAGANAALPAASGRLSGLFSRVSMLPAADPVTRDDLARVEATVERLEGEVERLRQHVEFLEDLLEKRSPGAFSLPGTSADS
ncbi:MAG: hypothetical protein JO040_01710 [Gemmatimonadetes bacterium]|nr:hypothetical protein [Gemmatimonadota bacterium]